MEQELENRILKIGTLILLGSAIILTMLLGGCASTDPATRYAREHKNQSWEHYQDTWMDNEIEAAKDQRKQEKAKEDRSKELEQHRVKLERIKRN